MIPVFSKSFNIFGISSSYSAQSSFFWNILIVISFSFRWSSFDTGSTWWVSLEWKEPVYRLRWCAINQEGCRRGNWSWKENKQHTCRHDIYISTNSRADDCYARHDTAPTQEGNLEIVELAVSRWKLWITVLNIFK